MKGLEPVINFFSFERKKNWKVYIILKDREIWCRDTKSKFPGIFADDKLLNIIVEPILTPINHRNKRKIEILDPTTDSLNPHFVHHFYKLLSLFRIVIFDIRKLFVKFPESSRDFCRISVLIPTATDFHWAIVELNEFFCHLFIWVYLFGFQFTFHLKK